mgnify:CR=1 FL=1
MWNGFKLGLQQSKQALEDWRNLGLQAAQDLFTGMRDNFKNFFLDAFHGQLKTAQEYFAAFGNKILEIFANVLSDMVTWWIESQIWKIKK